MNMEERAILCVTDSNTKRRYLHGPQLTLDFVLLKERDDDCFFPPSVHLSTSPSFLTVFQINRAGD